MPGHKLKEVKPARSKLKEKLIEMVDGDDPLEQLMKMHMKMFGMFKDGDDDNDDEESEESGNDDEAEDDGEESGSEEESGESGDDDGEDDEDDDGEESDEEDNTADDDSENLDDARALSFIGKMGSRRCQSCGQSIGVDTPSRHCSKCNCDFCLRCLKQV